MKISYSVLFCVGFVLIFAGSSNATIKSFLSELAEVEKVVAGQKFQEAEEELIMKGVDEDSILAKSALEFIHKEESKLNADKVSKSMKKILGSITGAIKIIKTLEQQTNATLDEALELSAKDPNAAIEKLQNNTRAMEDFIMTIGAPIEDMFGSALVMSGGAHEKPLKNGMTCMQKAGTLVHEAVRICCEVAKIGMEAGGNASLDAIKAAHEIMTTAGAAALENLKNGTKILTDASLQFVPKVLGLTKTNRIQEVMKSLTTSVTTDDPNALKAIGTLNDALETLLSNASIPQNRKDSAKVMIRSLVSNINETADAISRAKECLTNAEKLSGVNLDAATQAVEKCIQDSIDEIIHGTSVGFHGMGAAREIAGDIGIEKFVKCMLELINGRIFAYENMKLSKQVAMMGMKNGATSQGIRAAKHTCDAAGSSFNTQYVESGLICLRVLGE